MENNHFIRSVSDLKKFLPVLANSNPQKTLLIHSCCGPCSSTVLERLAESFKITIFYYNPNIDSYHAEKHLGKSKFSSNEDQVQHSL